MEYNELVSILIPCRNEEKYIVKCIDSILQFDYPRELIEIIIIDGLSTDRTRDLVRQKQADNNNIILLSNPEKTVPYAMNKGILHAKGIYIMRIDAHCEYPESYLSLLLYWSKRLNASNVGMAVETDTLIKNAKTRSVIKVLSDQFGVGNSHFRTGIASDYLKVDTVPFGFYKRQLFNEIGLYDIRFTRGQDIEFNKRLINNGGSIYLIGGDKIKYYTVENFRGLFSKYFKTGKWVIKVPIYTGSLKSVSLRHLIPLALVGYFLLMPLLLALTFSHIIFTVTFFPLFVYLMLLLNRGFKLSRQGARYYYVLWGFVVLHIAYGLGSVSGLFSACKK